MRPRTPKLALVSLLAAGLGASCTGGSTAPDPATGGYDVLGPDLEPFRSDFNARTDHVRAVLLVGPT